MPKESKIKDAKASQKLTSPKKGGVEKRRKQRAKKDPLAPKRGLSAYMFFSQEHRKQVQEDNPQAGFGMMGKILGEKWKNMSEAERMPYDKKAQADKERYERQKVSYKSGDTKAAGLDDGHGEESDAED